MYMICYNIYKAFGILAFHTSKMYHFVSHFQLKIKLKIIKSSLSD